MIASILFMLAGSPVPFTVQKQSWDAGASTAYLKVSTGDLDGDGLPDESVIKVMCTAGVAGQAYVNVRDSGSGMPTEKRQHGTVTITKEWGPSSPQFRAAQPTYDVKKVEGGKTMALDDWTAVDISGLPPVCAGATKTRSNIQNN